MPDAILAVVRDPFEMSPPTTLLPLGTSLQDMIGLVRGLPEGWPRHAHDVICINGHPVPPALWGMIRPKPAANGLRTEVSFHAPPMGGGDGEGKNPLALIAGIGLTLVSGGIASGAILGGVTGAAAAGGATIFSRLLGAGVALAGSAALSALSGTPSLPAVDEAFQQAPGTSAISGNALEPNGALPRVVGTFKAFLPFGTKPLTYYRGQDEVAELVGVLAGPHRFDEITIGGADITDMTGVEFEVYEGWPARPKQSLVTRYAHTDEPRSELRGFTVNPDNQNVVEASAGTATLEDALPQTKILSTREAPDEFWINLNFPQGISRNAELTTRFRVPFRLTVKNKATGVTKNLPELHFAHAALSELRAMIKLIWIDSDVTGTVSNVQTNWVAAHGIGYGQSTLEPATSNFVADGSFNDGAGADTYLAHDNRATSQIQNVILGDNEAKIYLNTADFPRGRYEISLTRGQAFDAAGFDDATYVFGSAVYDLFHYTTSFGAPTIVQTKAGLADRAFVVRHSSVWNAPPVQKGNVAYVALRVTNTEVQDLAATVSGYVRDWDGTGWNSWSTTANPAAHIRDALGGDLNADPLTEQIDDAMLTALRDDGAECHAILQDVSVGEACQVMAGCARAKLYQSEVIGVIRDRDRTGDAPEQIFSDANARNFSWSKGFADLPDGYRATFFDVEADYQQRQIIHPKGARKTEQVTIRGLVTEADVRSRLQYDLDVLRRRNVFYSWEAGAEAIKVRRGSLVGFQFATLSDEVGSGRIEALEYDAAGDVAAVILDCAVEPLTEATFDAITDLSAVPDMARIGLRTGVTLRRSGGVMSTHEVDVTSTGTRVAFATPFAPAGLAAGDLAVFGIYGQELRRGLVLDATHRRDLVCTITVVPEAPDIWSAA